MEHGVHYPPSGMRFSLGFSTVAFALAACAAPPSDREEPKGSTESAIVNGSASPTAQDATVLISDRGEGICSGTLIAPNLVLTARHCVADYDPETDCGTITSQTQASRLTVSIGAAASPSAFVARGVKLYVPDTGELCSADIALLSLDEDVKDVTPVKVSFASPSKDVVGTAVGYGADQRTQRADIKILAVGPVRYSYPTRDGDLIQMDPMASEIVTTESTCFGDSGGPLLDDQGRIFAVASRGPDDVCRDRGSWWTTLDGHEQLIRDTAKAVGHPIVDVAPSSKPNAATNKNNPATASDSDDDDDGDSANSFSKKKKDSTKDEEDSGLDSGGCSATRRPTGADASFVLGLVLALLTLRRSRPSARKAPAARSRVSPSPG